MRCLSSLVVAWFALSAGPRAGAELEIGDKAPALHGVVVKGDAVDPAAGVGKVYVVEFWATWSPACRGSIPHLSSIAQRLRAGVIVVGVSDEDLDTVKAFDLLERMTYNVMIDPSPEEESVDETGEESKPTTRTSYETWMDGVDSIPHAFIVSPDGRIAWAGRPLDDQFDPVLNQVVAGDYDIDAARERAERLRDILSRYDDVIISGDVQAAFDLFDEGIAIEPMKLRWYLPKMKIARETANKEVHAATRRMAARNLKDDAEDLNELAWEVLIAAELDSDAVAFGFAIARRAVDLSLNDPAFDADGKANHLDTLARAWYMVGRLDQAIEIQSRAVSMAASVEHIRSMTQTLDNYRKLLELSRSGPPPFDE